MDIDTQTDLLTNDLCNLINRYKGEFELNDQTIIGVLEFIKYDLLAMSVIEFDPDFDVEDEEEDED
tara:strand:- start:107 stop:304 length:198 start_codon:yes stop_codon:yes gene_type:complete